MNTEPLLALSNATVHYRHSEEPVLHQVNFALHDGECVGLVGPNGCGKTTLLLTLVGLIPLHRGELRFQGRVVRGKADFVNLRRAVGFVFQNPDDQLFSPTVLEDVAFGPLNLGLSQDEALTRSQAILHHMELEHLIHRQPHTLSGGQKRLVGLATVLVMQPRILLLDEPTNDLDMGTRERVITILKNGALLPEKPALVIAGHDQGLLDALVDRRFAMGPPVNARCCSPPSTHSDR